VLDKDLGQSKSVKYFHTRLRKIANFLVSFERMMQKMVTVGNCLQFPEIPAKFREIVTEKSATSVDFQQVFF
jgi:hypothetical protein